MLRVCELNVKNPAFAQQKNITNAKGFSLKNYLWTCQKLPTFEWRALTIKVSNLSKGTPVLNLNLTIQDLQF